MLKRSLKEYLRSSDKTDCQENTLNALLYYYKTQVLFFGFKYEVPHMPRLIQNGVRRSWRVYSVLLTSLPNCHILWSFDPMSYLGANYLMVQLTVEQVDMATNVCF